MTITVKSSQETPSKRPVADNARSADNSSPSKAMRLADVMADNRLYQMGKEFCLFVRLLVVERGSLSGTYESIGRSVGGDYRVGKRYASALEIGKWVIVNQKEAREVTIQLVEPYYSIAMMDDASPQQQTRFNEEQDENLERIIDIYKTATKNGQGLTVQIDPLLITPTAK